MTMLAHSFRILWYHRFFTFINIVGMLAGITSCLFIYLYVQNEWSYDTHHSKRNRVYRVVSELSLGGKEDKTGLSSFMLSPTLKEEYPEVQDAVRVMPIGEQTMWVDDKPFRFKDNLMSDAGFFNLFDYEFLEGDPNDALTNPQSVVITDEVALKLFGEKYHILGRVIRYSRQSYTITGVVKDIQNNSHLYFNTILSINSLQPQFENSLRNDWFYLAQTNYILFKEETNSNGFETKLAQFRDKHITPWLKQVNSEGNITFHLQPITSIHFSNEYPATYSKSGNKSYTYIFSFLAAFMLIIACFNYINLATAAAAKRSKEIAIKKTAGAQPSILFFQFMRESFIIIGIAILSSILCMYLLMPIFNQITNKSLGIVWSINFVLLLLLLLIVIGLIAGAFPAFYLSRLQPALLLKANKLPGGFSASFRKLLIVLQFVVAILFISCTSIIYAQMFHLKNTDMGFDKQNMMVVSVPFPDTAFVNKFEVIKHELSQNPNIKGIALTNSIPGNPIGTLIHNIETPSHQIEEKALNFMTVSSGFLPLLNIPITEGRNFDETIQSDDTAAFIVNEQAIKTFGWKNPLGYVMENGLGYKGKIVGVIQNFNYQSLHDPIQPLVLLLGGKIQGNLLIKIAEGKEDEVIPFTKHIWELYSKRYPFDYYFVDDNFNKLYQHEDRLMTLFSAFSIISLVISCLGLFAMVVYSLEQRTKEIGIRKVMGATEWNIITIIGKDFLLLFVIAFVIAIPLSMYVMTQWLNGFANRTEISPLLLIGVILSVGTISMLTLLIKTKKAASVNPVKSLRYE
jgi:putative ABC transport system permease protein